MSNAISSRILNTIGLVLGIIGVIIVFVWGPPQPQLDPGVSIGLEDNTPIDKTGKTVREYNQEVEVRRKEYSHMSQIGLVLVMVGFAFQLWATWVPSRPPKLPDKAPLRDLLSKENVSPVPESDKEPHNEHVQPIAEKTGSG
jgi:hypothetical protein